MPCDTDHIYKSGQDETLLGQVDYYITYILDHQQPDGWLGPTDSTNPWSRFPLCLALLQYHEANPTDTRVISAIYSWMHKLFDNLWEYPLETWAAARWQEMVLATQIVYDNYLEDGEKQVSSERCCFLLITVVSFGFD